MDVVDPLLELPRPVKRALVLAVDCLMCVATVWFAFYLRLDEWVRLYGDPFWRGDWAALISVVIAIPLFISHGFYRVIFRHANLMALNMVVRAFAIYWLLYAGIITMIGLPGVPRTVGIIQPLLLIVGVGLSRALAHYWLGGAYQQILKRASLPRALIYGAGEAGRQLAMAINNGHEMRVVGFLDDDSRIQGHVVHGLKIHDPATLKDLVIDSGVESVLLALPSISRHRRNTILGQIRETHVSVRTLPSVSDLAQGKVTVSDLRELDIEDLLGRDPVPPNLKLLARLNSDKCVMVTGAGGSIGSELCRQVIQLSPNSLILFEQSEYALYRIQSELEERTKNINTKLCPILGSVQDQSRVKAILERFKPDTIYHAAAYKHVPLVQDNPAEGIKNNVLGTANMAKAAIDAGVCDFVLISTDKAVRPTNIMGATKRLAEMVLQALASLEPSTKLTMVRFGNVLGSSGSVVPKFRQQILEGGPVTVTHPDVTRYFMTIPEAAELVLQAGAMAQGGDVYVLEMGEPVKIMYLARRMIELSGLRVKEASQPNGDIEIEICGLRPGEKLYEELLIGDNPQATDHPRIMRASEEFLLWPALEPYLKELERCARDDDGKRIDELLSQLVAGYRPYKINKTEDLTL